MVIKMKNSIMYHADDYGVTLAQSEKILSCYQEGVLNSISIFPNSPMLKECLQKLEEIDTERTIRRVIHLNFVEGRPVADSGQVSLLVDKTGYFDKSFVQILKYSYLKYDKLKQQLKLEIRAQLQRVITEHDCHITAVDSHQHYHMIPAVFDALMEVLTEDNIRIDQIRIPVDPLTPVMTSPPVWRELSPVNFVKWAVLKLFQGRNRKILLQRKIESPVFFGIFFTCQMKTEVVEELLPKYWKYAQKKEKNLELMFHPGNLTAGYELLDERSQQLRDFYMSENRFLEATCLKQLGKQKEEKNL